MSWLINLMNNGIGENFMLHEIVQEIWEAARETYFNIEDTVQTFEIEGILHDLHQGKLSLTQYFSLLTHYWQPLDMFETTNGIAQRMQSNTRRSLRRNGSTNFY